MATEHDGASLASRVKALVAAAEGVVAESEARLVYRREHGLDLSLEHKDALSALLTALDGLRSRLAQIVGPDAELLRQEFAALQERLADMEVQDHG